MVGIVEEQHPDRARLFMQWKQMEWPILVDSLNLLNVSAVPITLLIDEGGIVRFIRPTDEDFHEFLETSYETVEAVRSRQPQEIEALEELARAARSGAPDDLKSYARHVVLWETPEELASAIAAYGRALEIEPSDGPTQFRRGVAYRKRYDSPSRQDGDFAAAVRHWERALEIDPNQYIWRRRIQQYGPRLDKPYSFYDWVLEARQVIAARGEKPVSLVVEPGGAEFARPIDTFSAAEKGGAEPDPRGRIHRDQEGLIQVEKTVVPAQVSPGESCRAHVVLRPNIGRRAHWNNEVGELVFWVDPPSGWDVDRQLLSVALPAQPVSQEERRVEFELKAPETFDRATPVRGYALYYVCEDVDGTCLYRRQDVTLVVEPR